MDINTLQALDVENTTLPFALGLCLPDSIAPYVSRYRQFMRHQIIGQDVHTLHVSSPGPHRCLDAHSSPSPDYLSSPLHYTQSVPSCASLSLKAHLLGRVLNNWDRQRIKISHIPPCTRSRDRLNLLDICNTERFPLADQRAQDRRLRVRVYTCACTAFCECGHEERCAGGGF